MEPSLPSPPPATPSPPQAKRYPLDWQRRLHGRRTYRLIFDQGKRKTMGPITLIAHPNGLPLSRLGLVTPRKVGSAPRRARVKRMLREAFRLSQHESPPGYDVLVLSRAHEPLTLPDYQQLILQGMRSLDKRWKERQRPAAAT